MVGLSSALLNEQQRDIVLIIKDEVQRKTIILGQKDQIQYITSIYSVTKSLMLA